MRFALSRWSPGHLLAAWSAYWVGLAAVTLTPIVLAIMRATAPGTPPGTANVSASFSGSTGVTITITRMGKTVLERSAGYLPMALWIGAPPLLLWALWVGARSRALSRARALPGGPGMFERLTTPPGELAAPGRGREEGIKVERRSSEAVKQ